MLATTAYVGLGLGAPAAPAQSGGSTGGASATPPPTLKTVKCRTLCEGIARARVGSEIAVRGRRLRNTERVVFLGSRAKGDETVVSPTHVKGRRVLVEVPEGTVTGPVTVTTSEGETPAPTSRRLKVEQVETRRVRGDGVDLEIAVTGRKAFFDGRRQPTLTFRLEGSRAAHTTVQVVRAKDGSEVSRYDEGLVAPGETRVITWDGLIAGKPAPEGRYEFRVSVDDGQGARASSASSAPPQGASPDSFLLMGHKFPVRGKHDYGEYAASFGGGRGHQGHDVFAACGTRLVAARGGVVKHVKYHSRAGHYLIIDGEGTGVDYAYMHLREAPPVSKGDRVRTGQTIGRVGDTGRASGCHLHFEMWSAPGWYTGGEPFDPLPHLQAWDEYS